MTDILDDDLNDSATENRLRQLRAQADLERETAQKAAAPERPNNKRARRVEYDPAAPLESHQLRFAEKVDLKLLEYLEANFHLLGNATQEKAFRRYAEWARQGNGIVQVVYRRPKAPLPDYGRFYAMGGSALQSFKWQLRATLARRRYWQIDIKNCHPTILENTARETFKMRTPCLQRYVAHREEVLASTGFDRELAKKVMLIMSYGGNAEKRCNVRLPPFLRSYRQELNNLADCVYRAREDLARRLEAHYPKLSNYRIKFKVMSFVCQDLDSRMSLAAMRFLGMRGWVTSAYMHDGFLVEKRTDGVQLDAALLSELDTYISGVFECPGIHFEKKALQAPYTLPAELQHLAPMPGSDEAVADVSAEELLAAASFDGDDDPDLSDKESGDTAVAAGEDPQ